MLLLSLLHMAKLDALLYAGLKANAAALKELSSNNKANGKRLVTVATTMARGLVAGMVSNVVMW
eukprot:7280-Heterococcus_DN1.PRE.2